MEALVWFEVMSSRFANHADGERKNIFASQINSMQRRGRSFFEKNRHHHHHTSSCLGEETFNKGTWHFRKRLSLNFHFDSTERNSLQSSPSNDGDNIDIQLLTPENFRTKSHSLPSRSKIIKKQCGGDCDSPSPSSMAVRSDQRTYQAENQHNRVSRKLSKEDMKFVEQTFIKKRCSMCLPSESDGGGFDNYAFFMQNQQVVLGFPVSSIFVFH